MRKLVAACKDTPPHPPLASWIGSSSTDGTGFACAGFGVAALVTEPALPMVRVARASDNKPGRAGARGGATVVVGAGAAVVGVVVGEPLTAARASSTASH